MTITDLHSFNNILNVCKGSVQQRVFRVKEALHEQCSIDLNAMELLLWVQQGIEGDLHTITITQQEQPELYDYLANVFPNDDSWEVGTNRNIGALYGTSVEVLRGKRFPSGIENHYYGVFFDTTINQESVEIQLLWISHYDDNKFVVQPISNDDEWKAIQKETGSLTNPVTSLIEQATEGAGLMASFHEVASTAFDHCLDDNDAFYNAISDTVDELPLLSQDQLDIELKSASQNGPISLIGKISGILSSYLDKAEQDQAAGYEYFRNPSISLQTMSWGFILNNIGTVLSTVGMFVSVLNPIIGAITMGVGLVVSGITKAVINYTSMVYKTHFSIENIKGEHCFNFCVNQYVIESNKMQYLKQFMYDLDTNVITIKSPDSPVVSLVFYSQDDDTMWVEEHLSLDFHFSAYMECFSFNKVYPSGTETNNTKFALDILTSQDGWISIINQSVHPSSVIGTNQGRTLPVWFDHNPYDINVKRMVHDLCFKWYDPLSSDMLYELSKMNSLEDDINQAITERLYTAMFLYCLYQLRFLIKQISDQYDLLESSLTDSINISDVHWSTFYIKHFDDNPVSSFYIKVCKLMQDSMMYFLSINSTKNSDYSIDLSTLTDRMSVDIADLFDGLTAVKNVDDVFENGDSAYINNLLVYVAVDENYFDGRYCAITATSGYSWYDARECLGFMMDNGIFQGDPDYNTWIKPWSYPGWNKNALITLPTVTMSAVIMGLIFDGLVIVGAIALTISAYAVKRTINNKRARAQSKAENSWYEYGKMANDPNVTEEQLDAQWKVYKADRFATNFWATLSGHSRLSLGYYDSKKEEKSILDTFRSAISNGGSEHVDKYSLKYIAKLINNK